MNTPDNDPYQLMTAVIKYIQSDISRPLSLHELAQYVRMSEAHFQRLFSRWAGVSPKRFQQFLTKQRAKQILRQNHTVEDVTQSLGLSGSSRLHDLMVRCEAMTPGEMRQQGQGLCIRYGTARTPLGSVVIAWTARGICYLAFYDDNPTPYTDELITEWPRAEYCRDNDAAASWVERIFLLPEFNKPLYLLLKGTNFQIKVWEALLRVSPGQLISYSQLAQLSGSPNASRAVGSAMAANKLGFLIPCHRVIRESGETGQYRWGAQRKTALQVWEACKVEKALPISEN